MTKETKMTKDEIDEEFLISLYKESSFLSNKIEVLKRELKPLEICYEAVQNKIKEQFINRGRRNNEV